MTRARLLILALLSAAPRSASADDRKVHVEASGCPELSPALLSAALRLELPDRLGSAGQGSTFDVACAGGAATITPREAPELRVRADLAGAARDLWPRLVALSVAELVRELDARPVATAREPPAARALPLPGTPPDRPLSLGLHAVITGFGRSPPHLHGAALSLAYGVRIEVGGALGYVQGRAERPQGTLRASLAYGAPRLGLALRRGPFTLRAGFGWAVGRARVVGDGRTGRDGRVAGPWAAPLLDLGLAFTPVRALTLDVRGFAGWVVAPVRGEVQPGRDILLSGPWTGLTIGVSIDP